MSVEQEEIEEEIPAEEQLEEVAEEEVLEEEEEEAEESPEDLRKRLIEEGKRIAERGFAKSMGKEVSKRKRLEDKLELLVQRNDELISRLDPAKKVEPPKMEDFDSDVDYQIAVADYVETKRAEKAPKAKEESAPYDRTLEQRYIRKENAYAEEHEDYIESKENLTPFLRDPGVVDALHESGPAVVHYLGKNMDLAEDLLQLPPARMGRELAKLENQFGEDQAPAKRKAKPEPPASPRARRKGTKSLADMSQAEYNKFMANL